MSASNPLDRATRRPSPGLTRRSWLAAALALTGGAALGRPRVAQAGSAKLLVVGDSMIAGAVGIALARDLEEAGYRVKRRGKTSSGLSRPDFFDWIEEGGKLFAAHQPDAVVCMFGGNDGQGLYMGKGAPSKWIRWAEPGWDEEYRRRIDAFADAITPGGQQLFWIGMPIMGPERLRQRMAHMNTLYQARMEARTNGRFIDVWDALADEEGNYQARLVVGGSKQRVRADDGVHMTLAGASLVVQRVRPVLDGTLG
jgi:hypothetical protein